MIKRICFNIFFFVFCINLHIKISMLLYKYKETMMKKTIKDFDLNNKRVLIRCDFNVPIKDGKITDDNRIVESLPTIKYALDNNAMVILFSHLGKVKTFEDRHKKSLEIVSKRLGELLNKNIIFIAETRGQKLEDAVSNMRIGDILLVENTRFEDLNDKLESGNDDFLAKYWASLGDIFINDAFGTAHRAHASNVGIASNIPSGIGFLIEKELNSLDILNNPSRPYSVILGGAKISDKIEILSSLIPKADKILIGGGMAFTFLKALGYNVGTSLVDLNSISFAKEMLNKYSSKIVLPVDVKVTPFFADTTKNEIVDINNIDDDKMGLDIGPKSIKKFKEALSSSATIFWNGTLGYSEYENYADGTREIMKYIVTIPAVTILGGGDTVAASKKFGYKDKVTYASTGGGATLEYISGKKLPGIEIISENKGC